MSVVCAKVYGDKIVVAADSIVVYGWSKDTNSGFSKLLKINGMIVGACGRCDELSFLYHFCKTHRPESATERDVLSFFAEFSAWKNEKYGDKTIENSYIFDFDKKVFRIEGFFVREIKDHTAIGAGEDYARAALYLGHSPKEAVKVSCDLCCFVAEPIVEEELSLTE